MTSVVLLNTDGVILTTSSFSTPVLNDIVANRGGAGTPVPITTKTIWSINPHNTVLLESADGRLRVIWDDGLKRYLCQTASSAHVSWRTQNAWTKKEAYEALKGSLAWVVPNLDRHQDLAGITPEMNVASADTTSLDDQLSKNEDVASSLMTEITDYLAEPTGKISVGSDDDVELNASSSSHDELTRVIENDTESDSIVNDDNHVYDDLASSNVLSAAYSDASGMIALIPSRDDSERLAIADGESKDQLHVTLMFLGDDMPEWSPELREACIDQMRYVAGMYAPITADAFSINVFNPMGENPCVVLGITGDTLESLMTSARRVAYDIRGDSLPEQHSPWIPHITLKYMNSNNETFDIQSYIDKRMGSIVFDRIRVAFGDDIRDLPLGEELDMGVDDKPEINVSMSDDVIMFEEDGTPIVPNVLISLDALQKEQDVNAPGGVGHNLRNYWVHGEGAAKIRWGTEGSMDRCIRYLSEYVADAGGLCAEYHHAATGEWPRGGNVPSSSDVEEFEAVDDMPQSELEDAKDDNNNMDEYSTSWSGVLTVEGIESGDGRMFAPHALTWDEPPLPLMWQKETSHGGDNNVSVRVGSINKIWRAADPSNRPDVYFIYGEGTIDLGNPDGVEVYRRMSRNYMRGNSVDVDSVKDADIQFVFPDKPIVSGDSDEGDDVVDQLFMRPETTIFTKGRIRATTLVEIPAFTEARLTLLDALTSSAFPSHSSPTASDDTWNASTNLRRLPTPVPLDVARKVFAWYDNDFVKDGAIPKHAGRYPHHEVSENGTPGAVNLVACSGVIGALNGARGGTNISEADRKAVYNHIAKHMRDADRTPPPLQSLESLGTIALTTDNTLVSSTHGEEDMTTGDQQDMHDHLSSHTHDEDSEALVAATFTIEVTDTPPRAWFDAPTDVTPTGALTVTPEGRIFGYIAPANVRHRSFQDRATYVPMKKVDYTRFMGGETIVADGGRVTTGNITMGCGHASVAPHISATAAAEHYDNTCSIVATVRVGENQHGVWMAGALLPGLSSDQIRRIMACRLSGDWRPHLDRPGWREFVAALLVPVPGFPMARTSPSMSVHDGVLVASSVPVQMLLEPAQAVYVEDSNDADVVDTHEVNDVSAQSTDVISDDTSSVDAVVTSDTVDAAPDTDTVAAATADNTALTHAHSARDRVHAARIARINSMRARIGLGAQNSAPEVTTDNTSDVSQYQLRIEALRRRLGKGF